MTQITKSSEEPVCVLAIHPGTGISVTSTSCDRQDAAHYAQYYRSVGYRTRTLEYAYLQDFLEEESARRRENIIRCFEEVGQ